MSAKKVVLFGVDFAIGSMGIGMARSLLRAGHIVWGYDIRAEVTENFAKESGNSQSFADEHCSRN